MVSRRTSQALSALVLSLLTAACSMVGYPSGSAGPAPSDDAPPSMPRGEGAPTSPPPPRSDGGRTYEVFGVEYQVLGTASGYDQTGLASWYGEQFHGRPTASGETYDMNRHSAAHRTLPLHTWVEVTNLDNGRSLVVRVNDRGPFAHTDRRILDLSYSAARELGVVGPGTAPVRVRAVDPDERAGRLPD